MLRDDWNFMIALRSQSHANPQQAARLKELYTKYINAQRASVLNSTCSTCVVEMMGEMCHYIDREDLIIEEDN